MEEKRVRVIEIKKSVFENNDRQADQLRQELREKGIFLLNLMSSPGSGKTTTLTRTIEALRGRFRIAVMEADIDSDIDARKIAALGVETVQLHTGGMCHLDAGMTRQGIEELTSGHIDIAILENVGNLVCPAEFDTGAARNAMILSVPEGDDKPLKYPLMFQVCDVVLINKMDVLPYFDFDLERCRKKKKRRASHGRKRSEIPAAAGRRRCQRSDERTDRRPWKADHRSDPDQAWAEKGDKG